MQTDFEQPEESMWDMGINSMDHHPDATLADMSMKLRHEIDRRHGSNAKANDQRFWHSPEIRAAAKSSLGIKIPKPKKAKKVVEKEPDTDSKNESLNSSKTGSKHDSRNETDDEMLPAPILADASSSSSSAHPRIDSKKYDPKVGLSWQDDRRPSFTGSDSTDLDR